MTHHAIEGSQECPSNQNGKTFTSQNVDTISHWCLSRRPQAFHIHIWRDIVRRPRRRFRAWLCGFRRPGGVFGGSAARVALFCGHPEDGLPSWRFHSDRGGQVMHRQETFLSASAAAQYRQHEAYLEALAMAAPRGVHGLYTGRLPSRGPLTGVLKTT